MAEGKTLIPTIACSVCDDGGATNFCVNCQQELCTRCSKAHSKIQATSHHQLIPIGDTGKSGAESKATSAYCNHHTSKPLSIICEQCQSALCQVCADNEHRGHKLLRTKFNVTLLQRISAQKIPEFMDVLHQLENKPEGSSAKLDLYKSARDMVISWRDHLSKLIEDDSKKLLEQIGREIKKQEKLLADIVINIKDSVQDVDEKITILSNARKIGNEGTLLTNIHESDKIIQKARSLLTEIESTRQSYTIDDLLPFKNEVKNLEQNLHGFFTMTPLVDAISKNVTATPGAMSTSVTSTPRAMTTNVTSDPPNIQGKTRKLKPRNYKSMTKVDKYLIGKLGSDEFFAISETCQQNNNTVVIYHFKRKDIYMFDIKNNQIKRYAFAKPIGRMATLSNDIHVVVDLHKEVHILDADFSILSSLSKESGDQYISYGVHAVSADTFILLDIIKQSRIRVSELRVSNRNIYSKRKLCELDFHANGGFLALHNDQKQITVCHTDTRISTVELNTGRVTILDLQSHIGHYLLSICADETDNLLIGDQTGKIHMVTSTQYECELVNMKDERFVGGISLRGDKVIVVAGEYINIYK